MAKDNTERNGGVTPERTMGPFLAAFVVLTRAAGLVLLVVGIVTMTRVVFEAWGLYQQPDKIVRFAEAIERGSNIDKVLLPRNRTSGNATETSSEQRYTATGDDLRPSYFLSWIVVVPLLLAIGLVALWATRAGAELTIFGWPRAASRR